MNPAVGKVLSEATNAQLRNLAIMSENTSRKRDGADKKMYFDMTNLLLDEIQSRIEGFDPARVLRNMKPGDLQTTALFRTYPGFGAS